MLVLVNVVFPAKAVAGTDPAVRVHVGLASVRITRTLQPPAAPSNT